MQKTLSVKKTLDERAQDLPFDHALTVYENGFLGF
jgi:hypothetical protein